MKQLFITAIAVAISATTFGHTKSKLIDSTKTIKHQAAPFPINEKNAEPLFQLLAVFNGLMEDVPNLGLTGKQIKDYQSYIQQYQAIVKEWANKKAAIQQQEVKQNDK